MTHETAKVTVQSGGTGEEPTFEDFEVPFREGFEQTLDCTKPHEEWR